MSRIGDEEAPVEELLRSAKGKDRSFNSPEGD